MVGLKAIAERAGVSVETVSRVLNGRYRQAQQRGRERVAHVQAIARDLGYQPNAAARAMLTRRTLQVGVVLAVDAKSQLAHASAAEAVFGINSVLAPAGYVMSLVPVPSLSTAGEQESRALRERVLDGMVLMDELPAGLLAALRRIRLPKVWVNVAAAGRHDTVSRNEQAAGACCVAALGELGYRRIIYIDRRGGTHFSFAARRQGALQRAQALGMAVEVMELALPTGESATTPAFWSVFSPGAALVVADSYLARRLQVELSMQGFGAGRHYALTCCDDSDELNETFPELARASFDRFGMGARAATMMLEKLAAGLPGQGRQLQHKPVVLEPQWRSRRSAPPASELGSGSV